MVKIIIQCLLLFSLLISAAFAQDDSQFVVRKIEVQGAQRMSSSAVQTYLPIKRGKVLSPENTAEIVRSLYKTGFFERITLSRRGNTLVIHVVERPTIGQLKISGNSAVPTDKLTAVMKSLDIAEGRVYNPAVLEKISQSLLNQYYLFGRFNAHVDVNVTPMPRNRVSVDIRISEGLVAKVRGISILGNHVFDENTLDKQLDVSTTGLFSFITQSDRYSEEKLAMSLDKLRNYYLDRGYLHFEIKSSQAEITPDRKSVYITAIVEEGELYTVEKFELDGDLILPREEYMKHITIQPGQVFSRQKVIDTEKMITNLLGDKGYLFATVSVHPTIHEKTHQVVLRFRVHPGKLTYVRHVTFSDNTRTNDVVLRREVEQLEAAPASTSKLEESKHRLNLLPYIKNVDMSLQPVPGEDDSVDVNYKVKEDSSAQATFKLGYSQVSHVVLGAGLNQKNFLGTGNTLGLNLSHSAYQQLYALDYTDPYYTVDGISRSVSFSVSRVDPSAVANMNNGYSTNEYDLGLLYGIPVGQEHNVYSRVQAGAIYQDTLLNIITGKISNQVNAFVTQHGRRFNEVDFRIGYSRDGRDKAITPTHGTFQTLFLDAFAPVTDDSVSFYTLNYHGKWYQPLNDEFIVLSRGDFSYGNGFHGIRNYPFFRNYFAGGMDSVRGYQGYTLGPRDSNGQAYGGNILIDASLGLIFPNYLSDSLRTSVFVDAGNVYSTANNKGFGCTGGTCSTNSGPVRFSTGVEADVMTPFGPIAISLAQPLNLRPHDEQQTFQFALGANF